MSKFCSNCGKQVDEEKFCSCCAAAQKAEQSDQSQGLQPKCRITTQVPAKKRRGALGCFTAIIIPTIAWGIVTNLIKANAASGSSADDITFIFLPLFLIVSFCGYMAIKLSVDRATLKKEIQMKKATSGCMDLMTLEHIAGLPIPQGVPCDIYLYNDKLVFLRSASTQELSFDKITDMCVKTETEIQNSYVSSAGGAVGGALLFGPLGAIVGGRAKQKTSRTINNFFIITYEKDNVTEFISFKCTGNSKVEAFIRHFDTKPKQYRNVTL